MTSTDTEQRGQPRRLFVRIVVGLSFVAAVWFILGDVTRRSSLASIGVGGFSVLLGLAVSGSLLIAGSWAAVAGAHVGSRSALIEYLIYQPAKYLPGGVAQGLLQVSHVQGAVGSWVKSSGVLVVHMGVLATAGAVVAVPAVVGRVGVAVASLIGASVVGVAVLLVRMSSRFTVSFEILPPPVRLIGGLLMASAGLALWGAGYALTIEGLIGGELDAAAVPQFGAGWLAGFLALPIPAGVGVREAALVALSDHPVSMVATASIVVRLAVAGAEFVLALVGIFVSRTR